MENEPNLTLQQKTEKFVSVRQDSKNIEYKINKKARTAN